MSTQNLINNFPDLENVLNSVEQQDLFGYQIKGNTLSISIPYIEDRFIFTENDLKRLNEFKKVIRQNDLKYIDSYGYKYKNLYEIAISVSSPTSIGFFDNDFFSKPLVFDIDLNKFIVGPGSPLFVLLTEPVYSSKFFREFDSFITITMLLNDTNNDDYKSEFTKALYVINAEAFKDSDYTASLLYLNQSVEYEEYEDDEVSDDFQQEIDNFINIEPLALYNYAQALYGVHRFLHLYRILEFFMNRAFEAKLKGMRYDKSISESQLISHLKPKGELKLLENLVDECITVTKKEELIDIALSNNLISERNYSVLIRKLYEFRNSVVHAKETQIENAVIPDPFELDFTVDNWIGIVSELARQCIAKYNRVDGG